MKLNLYAILFFSSIIILLSFFIMVNVKAQSNKFSIDSVVLQNETGYPKTTFARGRFIMVNATIRNIMIDTYQAEPFLMLARMTKDSTMLGLGALGGSLLPGGSLYAVPGILIPTDATPGTYQIKVLLWSTWVSHGGIAEADPVEVTFTVT